MLLVQDIVSALALASASAFFFNIMRIHINRLRNPIPVSMRRIAADHFGQEACEKELRTNDQGDNTKEEYRTIRDLDDILEYF